MASQLVLCAVAIVIVIVSIATHQVDAGLGIPLTMKDAVVLGLTTFKQTESGQSYSKKLLKLRKMPDDLFNYATHLSNTAEAAVNAMVGDSDGPGVVKLIEPKLKSWSVHKNTCLNGIKFTFENRCVTMSPGNLLIDKNQISIEGHTSDEEGSATSRTIFIAFKLPYIKFNYDFKTKPRTIFERSRNGKVSLRLKGPNSLVLRVRVDSLIENVKRKQQKNACFLRIREVSFEMGEEIEVLDILYDSFAQNNINYGLTQQSFKKLVKDPLVRDGLIDSIKPSLKKAFEKTMRDKSVFCDHKNIVTAEPPKCPSDQIADLDSKRENYEN